MSDKYLAERQTFVNPDTGTTVNGLIKIVECERDNFEIVYLMNFCDLFDAIGGKKYKILKYLLQNRNSENIVIATVREIAKATNTSTNTVTKTLNVLKSVGAIATKTGIIMINPKVIIHGSKKKEDWIFTKFISIQENKS